METTPAPPPFVPVPVTPAGPAPHLPAPPAVAQLLAAFLAGRSAEPTRAYGRDLADLASFLGAPDAGAAAARLLAGGQGQANATVLAYRAAMLGKGLSPATVNRRLAAIRSLVALGRTLGLVPWGLDVPGVRSEAYRDVRGPGKKAAQRMLDLARARTDPKGVRDWAILRCLLDLALRRAEVARLDVADFDPQAGTLAVLGKGKREKVRLPLPDATAAALSRWLAVRVAMSPGPPCPSAPLFTSFDRARKGSGRLSGKAVYRIVVTLGAAAGVKTRTHGLRHLSISTALEALRGDVRKVKAFARHADVRTTLRYDDAVQDLGAQVARKVAGGFR